MASGALGRFGLVTVWIGLLGLPAQAEPQPLDPAALLAALSGNGGANAARPVAQREGCQLQAQTVLQAPPTTAASAASDGVRTDGARHVMHQVLIVLAKPSPDNLKCFDSGPTLYIDHIPFNGIPVRSRMRNANGEIELHYRLEQAASDADAWAELRLRAWAADTAEVTVPLGIGLTAKAETLVINDAVVLVPGWSSRRLIQTLVLVAGLAWPVLWLSGLLLSRLRPALLSSAWLVALRNLPRDRGRHAGRIGQNAAPVVADATLAQRSFSLGRMVLIVWLLTASTAIAVAWLYGGAPPNLSAGGLPLLLLAAGITSGTGAAIDLIRKTMFAKSDGLWNDLTADDSGLALHRLQAVLVNLAILALVWHDLYCYGTVANVDKGWAALMGVSSATYLYGKSSEGNAPVGPVPNPQG